jgi:hypothetical protein
MVKEMPIKREEKPKFPGRGSERNRQGKPAKSIKHHGKERRYRSEHDLPDQVVVERSSLLTSLLHQQRGV